MYAKRVSCFPMSSVDSYAVVAVGRLRCTDGKRQIMTHLSADCLACRVVALRPRVQTFGTQELGSGLR